MAQDQLASIYLKAFTVSLSSSGSSNIFLNFNNNIIKIVDRFGLSFDPHLCPFLLYYYYVIQPKTLVPFPFLLSAAPLIFSSQPHFSLPSGLSLVMMARQKWKPLITSFTSRGDLLAILSPSGFVKVWNTGNGSLLAEWKTSDGNNDSRFSCMACTFIGKKRRKDKGTCLVALGSDDGDVLAINVFTGEMKWKSKGHHPGGIINLSFANEGHRLRAVGANGIASEMNSETGEIIKELKLSKKSISSSVCSCDEKVVAAAATARVRLFSLEDGKELVKLSADLGSVQHISVSDDAKAIVTSGIGEKHLQVWKLELSIGSVSSGPILSMRHSPLTIECKNGCSGEDGLVVLSVSDSGVAYIWNLKTSSDDDIKPVKITIKANKAETDLHNSGRARKSRISIIAARIHALESNGQVTALITYGSADSPQFSLLDIPHTGEDIVITATEGTVESNTSTEQNGVPAGTGLHKVEAEAGVRNEKSSKKRAASDLETVNTEPLVDNGHGEPMNRVQTDDDLDEPTMGEKLADLNLVDDNKVQSHEQKEPSPRTKPPSADSVHVLLKQALHADDRVLLLDCLYRKDEKVVANSVSLLNPSDVLKLLQSLVSIIQSRGAILACALPWLRSLLLQHASGIMSQESSLLALHSLYQLVESRVSNFTPALQLSSSLDLLYTGTVDDEGVDENDVVEPFIFEDKDESDEEESEDAMETDEEDDDTEVKTFSDVEGMSD